MLRFLSAGESHGPELTAIVEGLPAGLPLDPAAINAELRRRQGGYGRGQRQAIESDEIEIRAGTWQGETIGSPLALRIVNRDAKLERLKELPRPRPGHGDLAGAVKYHGSIRGVLERASARETAIRVAVGAVAAQLLRHFAIETVAYVSHLGPLDFSSAEVLTDPAALRGRRDASQVYSLQPERDAEAVALIDEVKAAGDTVGGVIEARVSGVPIGLGSHAHWDRKLDGRLAAAVMSIQAIKGVEIGLGFAAAARRGSAVHDPIRFDPAQQAAAHLGFVRPSNNAGGLEAGISNGQPIVVRAAMKPISTLQRPLESIEMASRTAATASYERSDVCAVPAASVIVEQVVAWEIAVAFSEKIGGDSLREMRERYDHYLELARQR